MGFVCFCFLNPVKVIMNRIEFFFLNTVNHFYYHSYFCNIFVLVHLITFPCCEESLIGEGGYAEVYKGRFQGGQFAAIKRLTRGTQEEMIADFLSELGIIVHVDHPNIAKLIGYGVEGGMHLVLQLSPHGSLASILYGLFSLLHEAFFINYQTPLKF